MKIKRKIETTNALYDLVDLNHHQFNQLFHCLESQLFVYRHRQLPDGDAPEGTIEGLYLRMKKMIDSSEVVI